MNLLQLWRKVFPPAPRGPCKYCGKHTAQHNMFDATMFRHQSCVEQAREREREEAVARKQIELYKRAIREVEEEKNQTKP